MRSSRSGRGRGWRSSRSPSAGGCARGASPTRRWSRGSCRRSRSRSSRCRTRGRSAACRAPRAGGCAARVGLRVHAPARVVPRPDLAPPGPSRHARRDRGVRPRDGLVLGAPRGRPGAGHRAHHRSRDAFDVGGMAARALQRPARWGAVAARDPGRQPARGQRARVRRALGRRGWAGARDRGGLHAGAAQRRRAHEHVGDAPDAGAPPAPPRAPTSSRRWRWARSRAARSGRGA